MEPNTNPAAQAEAKGPAGIVASVIVIVLILGFGAYYFLKQVPASATPTGTTTTTSGVTVPADPTVSALSAQGTSTDVNDIQKDLNATDLSNVGTGVSNVTI